MAIDLYLIRKLGTFAPYENVESVTLTSNGIADFTGVTGVAATNIITVLNFTPQNGDAFVFTAKTGGSGLTTGTTYYFGDVSGSTFKAYTAASGGTVVPLTTNIPAGPIRVLTDDLRVWSAEFRDTFSDTGAPWYAYESGVLTKWQLVEGQAGVSVLPNSLEPTLFTGTIPFSDTQVAASAVTASITDEKTHTPLRQTLLKRTHWRFDIEGFGPLYATWADGDIIATNPPNTIIDT